jgi:hypothetical protein
MILFTRVHSGSECYVIKCLSVQALTVGQVNVRILVQAVTYNSSPDNLFLAYLITPS